MNLTRMWVIAIVLAIILMLLPIILNMNSQKAECRTDSNCVPATCCHPTSCVSSDNAPKCDEILCSQECVPDTLDCGQGSCSCIEGKCGGSIK